MPTGTRTVTVESHKPNIQTAGTAAAFMTPTIAQHHPRCRHAIAELTHYSWKTDKLTGAILPKLADDNNHVIDAMRYALEGVRRAGTGRTEYRSAGPRVTLAATSAGDGTLIPGLKPYQNRSRGWGSVPGVFSNFDY
jgi:hypothetical protein